METRSQGVARWELEKGEHLKQGKNYGQIMDT